MSGAPVAIARSVALHKKPVIVTVETAIESDQVASCRQMIEVDTETTCLDDHLLLIQCLADRVDDPKTSMKGAVGAIIDDKMRRADRDLDVG